MDPEAIHLNIVGLKVVALESVEAGFWGPNEFSAASGTLNHMYSFVSSGALKPRGTNGQDSFLV